MRHPLRPLLVLAAAFLGLPPAAAAPAQAQAAGSPPNILFIAIDDLRPELGVYGSRALTPALDRLASEGVVFDRAYCQQALCAPSRTSLMTGLRPGVPGINATESRDKGNIKAAVDRVVTLPENLRNAGYYTMNVGKSFHTYDTTADGAWDVQMRPGGGHYQLQANLDREKKQRDAIAKDGPTARWRVSRGHAVESADVADDQYQTHRIATRAIDLLESGAGRPDGQPFFLSVGFYKPHLPFIAPQKYWDLYDREQFEVPSRAEPSGIAEFSLPESWYEVRAYGDIPRKGDLDDAQTREMLHGYHACVSFVDAQVERLLAALDERGLRENTVVIVWSDHGFKLGDYGDWSKYTNMEVDTHVPLFVSGPGVAAGQRTDALVELIDLYPTVADLAGAGVPAHVEATSFAPLLRDPATPWKRGALSYYDRRNPDGEGFSVRGERFRYTEWRDFESGAVLDRELYDHADGTTAAANLAEDPAYAADVERLAAMLAGGWKGLVPADAPRLGLASAEKPQPAAGAGIGASGGDDGEEGEGGEGSGGNTGPAAAGSFPAGPGGVLVYDGFTRDGRNGGAFHENVRNAAVVVGGVRMEAATRGKDVFRATGGGTGVGPDPAAGDFDLNPGDAFTLRFDARGTLASVAVRALGSAKTDGLLRVTNTRSGQSREVAFQAPARKFEDVEREVSLAFEAGETLELTAGGGANFRLLSLEVRPDATD